MIRRTACVFVLLLSACSASGADKAADPVALVQLTKAASGEVSEGIPLYGTVEAAGDSERTLPAVEEAIVASIEAPAGTAVRPGRLVARLVQSAQSALDLAKAQSDARMAKAAYARAQRLRNGGLAGDTEVETARAASASAQATLASLRNRRGMLSVIAPVSGVVEAFLVKPGDLVAAGAPVARIATGGAARARFGIDPALAGQAAGGRIVVSTTTGGPSVNLQVSGVDRVVDPATRLAAVFVDIPTSAGLALGQPLHGELLRPKSARGIVVPYAAVQDDGGVPYVYVVTAGVAHRRDVKLGAQAGDRVLVLSGVAIGDEVVTRGGTALDDGMKVRTGPMKADAARGEQ